MVAIEPPRSLGSFSLLPRWLLPFLPSLEGQGERNIGQLVRIELMLILEKRVPDNQELFPKGFIK